MGSFYLAPMFVVVLFPFQGLHMRLSQNEADFSNFGLRRLEAAFEIDEATVQPNGMRRDCDTNKLAPAAKLSNPVLC
jgi:hypothetical protein